MAEIEKLKKQLGGGASETSETSDELYDEL
jgi:hypothetical protein